MIQKVYIIRTNSPARYIMKKPNMGQPANIREFSTIVGLIFETLYKSHPIPKTIAPEPIMDAMGVASPLDVLGSGNAFNQMFSLTMGWLNQEGFTKYYGSHPRENVILTLRGLAAMNATPDRLKGKSVADALDGAADLAGSQDGRGKIASFVGDLLGSAAGSFTKSIGSG